MKLFIFIFLLFSCASNKKSLDENSITDYKLIYQKYGSTHFFGIGSGSGINQQLAIKIAKSKALGELASNIKVTVMSKIEMLTTFEENGTNSSLNESLEQQIISIGNATVRSPEYEILNIDVNKKDGSFKAEVIAKKNKEEHLAMATRDLDINIDQELIDILMD